MRSMHSLKFLMVSLCLLLSCGDTPSGPQNTPTPSELTVDFTGEEKALGHDSGESVCQVTATWTACPDADFKSYSLFRSASEGISGNPEGAELVAEYEDSNQLLFVDNDVNWGSTYYYAVRTANSQDICAWSNEAWLEIPGSTPTPSVLSVAADWNSILLEWTKCSDSDFSHYTLFRSSASGISEDTLSAIKLGTFTHPDSVSFSDSSMPQQGIYYAVRTSNTSSAISWSNEVHATPPTNSIVIWGMDDFGESLDPSDNANFVAIAAGEQHSLGLNSDGSILAWGGNQYGQCDVPAPNADFVAIAAGRYHCLGVKEDGSVVAWGWNDEGQCDVPYSPSSNFVTVACGERHSLALKANGFAIAWGWNDYGQCEVPSTSGGYADVAAGYTHSLGLMDDSSITAWGNNAYGQCDVPSPNSDFVAVAGGENFTLGLKADGSIVAWGDNGQGQCNVPSPNSDFVAIAAGVWHGLGLKADGSIVAWGRSAEGQCDVPSPNTGFLAVAGGYVHSLGLKE